MSSTDLDQAGRAIAAGPPDFAALEDAYARHNPARRKQLGIYFTAPWLVDRHLGVIDIALERAGRGWADVSVVEPSVGSGAYLDGLLARGVAPERLTGFELDPLCAQVASAWFPDAKIHCLDTLDVRLGHCDFVVVVGNPPYGRAKADARSRALTAPFKGTRHSNHLYNLYVQFWGWALRECQHGVVSLLTPSSWLDSPHFETMRRTLADAFDELWVVDVGGDVKLGHDNPFPIQTPVCIVTGVRR